MRGLMVESSKENGKTITWMVLEYIYGLMVENMRANIKKTRNTVLASTNGQMAGSILDGGQKENNTVSVNTSKNKEISSNWGSGNMENVSNGNFSYKFHSFLGLKLTRRKTKWNQGRQTFENFSRIRQTLI